MELFLVDEKVEFELLSGENKYGAAIFNKYKY
jgi:hypothetical protein